MNNTRAKDLAREIANTLNCFGFNQAEFNEQMMQEHRTLQQSFMRLIRDYCKYVAEQPDYMFDGRNEASQEFAEKVAEIEIGLPMI